MSIVWRKNLQTIHIIHYLAKVTLLQSSFPKTTLKYLINISPASLQLYIKCWAKPYADAAAVGRTEVEAVTRWKVRTIAVVNADPCKLDCSKN